EYDLGLGVTIRATEFTGVNHSYEYDALGRITRLVHPEGAAKDIEYHLANPVSHVVERSLEEVGGGTLDSFAYFDAYGRRLGTKTEAEGGKWRYLEAVRYNSRKLERSRWLPYETAGPGYEEPAEAEAHEQHSYDAKARPLRTVNPDGSFVRNVYEPLIVHHFDENDTAGREAPRSVRRDGLGRVVEVMERNGTESYVTAYRWSALGDLVEIRDAQDNRKTMVHDSLRRQVSMQDPDRGSVTHAYDDANNILRTEDARGQVIEREYDFANRLVLETRSGGGGGSSTLARYFYDTPSTDIDLGDGKTGTATFTPGRLAAVIDPSGETHFSYDARGNTAWLLKRIREPRSGLTVSFRTQFAYDALDRLREVVYPDNDRVRYAYNEGSFTERIDGGPGGAVLVEDCDYHPSGEIARADYGNGATSLFTYDERHRLRSLVTRGSAGDALIDHEYAYDPASNLSRIVDRRPFTAVERASPRRDTQVFAYDDLHRLTQARYAHSDDFGSNLGQIDYGYDAIGNLISRTTPPAGQAGHLSRAGVHLGAMTYAGGRSGRSGRRPGDPPGPHAVTVTASGRAFSYDANGNTTRIDGATLTWDAKDQVVSYEKGAVSAKYLYDYSDRRVAKSVATGDRTDETLYVNQHFEERPGGTPVKHVFSGEVRIARVEGAIDPARDRIQRLRLASGWNALTVAVETQKTLAQVFGADADTYTWRSGSYERLASSRTVPTGEPLWVHAPSARLAVIQGRYAPSRVPAAIPSGSAFLAWPRLEALSTETHLSAAGRIHLHDPHAGRFLLRDPSLPSFLQDLGASLPSARAFWIDAPPGTTLEPGARESQEILFYHRDHLGSSAVTTDRTGALVEELAYYPFGELRHRHAAQSSTPIDYDFTDKETDDESGLVYHGARFYNPSIGRFLSVDPLYGDPAAVESDALEAFLTNPQKLGLYSYVLNNPLKYSDPDGLEEKPVPGTVSRSAAEVAAAGYSWSSKPVPKAQGTIEYSKSVGGGTMEFDTTGGRLGKLPNYAYRSGWRRVTMEFTIKGPDGKLVKDHFFQVGIDSKNNTGSGSYAARTDARGVLKIEANVPEKGGEFRLNGFYDSGGTVKQAYKGGFGDFKRREGQDKIQFNVRLNEIPANSDDMWAGQTEVQVKQTK
ncbi:MAG: RHS repeat-associated core domain-containing protein, partial [Planctomycetes bacterium]|nr:RHS repeat-associated core domain-containing protein [Planctomycetota bacterium]